MSPPGGSGSREVTVTPLTGRQSRQFHGLGMDCGWNQIGVGGVHNSMDFVREPRVPVPSMTRGPVVVDAPPQIPAATPANLLARLLPAAMLAAAIGMMAVYFTSGAQTMRNPMYLFFPVMMLTSVVGTLVYGARGTNRTADINKDRQKYLNYLDTLDQAITSTADAQRRSLGWCHPEPRVALDPGRGQKDVGAKARRSGLLPSPAGHRRPTTVDGVDEPDLSSVDELDPVTVTAMQSLIRSRSTLADTPIALALNRFSVVTVDGDMQVARALLRSLICQLAILHGPDHIVIDAVVGAETSNEWDWLKWLPHYQHVLGPTGGVEQRHVVVILDGGALVGPRKRALPVEFRPPSSRSERRWRRPLTTKRLHLHVDAETVAVRAQDGDEVIARPDLLYDDPGIGVCSASHAVPSRGGQSHGAARLAGPDGDRYTPFRSRGVLGRQQMTAISGRCP